MQASDLRSLDWRVIIVLMAGAVCLLLQDTLGRSRILEAMPCLRGWNLEIAYGAIPFVCLVLLGRNPVLYFRLGRCREVLPLFGCFMLIVIGSCIALAYVDSWNTYYAGRFPTIELDQLARTTLTIVCGEFFFRGFLLFPLFEKFGWYALPMGILPYGLVHIGKPAIELYGSIPFGLGLAYLAVRSGSIWYGIAIHWFLNAAIPLALGLKV